MAESSEWEVSDLERSIGRLCMAWAHLEDDLFQLVNYLLGDIDVYAFEILRNQLDHRDALALSKNVAINRDDITTPHIVQLCDFINSTIRPERNRIVHDPIYVFGRRRFERVTYATKIIKQPKPVSLRITQYTHIDPAAVDQITELISAAQQFLSPITLCLDEGGEEGKPTAEAVSYLFEGATAFAAVMAAYSDSTKSPGTTE